MFSLEELEECTEQKWFKFAYAVLESTLLQHRLGLSEENDEVPPRDLGRFAQAVLASIPHWNVETLQARRLCTLAADIETGFALIGSSAHKSQHFLSAAILYDLASLPATAASIAARNGLDQELKNFFSRKQDSVWGRLHNEARLKEIRKAELLKEVGPENLVARAFGEIFAEVGAKLQFDFKHLSESGRSASRVLESVATTFSTDISCDQIHAALTALEQRRRNSTCAALATRNLNRSLLSRLKVPVELWPAQRLALEKGLLDNSVSSFGLAAPTGTGKTALTRILLADFFQKSPDGKALYISPSRALTGQIARDLHEALHGLDISVAALGAALTVHTQSGLDALDADVLIFTPEKADLLLRVQRDVIEKAELVIVDEAHHIEQGTRGILLEFYLWRLRAIISKQARIIQLSAVAPNIDDLVSWLAPKSKSAFAKIDCRSGKLRMAQFEQDEDGAGYLTFENQQVYPILRPGGGSPNDDNVILALIERLAKSGIVLVLTTSVARTEELATLLAETREARLPKDKAVMERLDARLERELYPACPLRTLVRKGVAFHHSQLPPRVRFALEQAIAGKEVNVVCATTTLAEGVNFPFSTVLVESLVGKDFELSPRALWNIAGRAGRFGVDSEGHCILFRPSKWKHKLKAWKYEDYLNTTLDGIPPVRSALEHALSDLHEAVSNAEIDMAEMESISLDFKVRSAKAKKIRGLLNVMRVGYAHAFMSETISLDQESEPEFEENILFAARQMSPDAKQFAIKVARQQRNVIRKAVSDNDELVGIAAQIGWTLETQSKLYDWVSQCEDWQLGGFGRLVLGGKIIQEQKLGYLLGPVSALMTEFEGETLGGYTAYLASGWILGYPLTRIRESQQQKPPFGRLVNVIYARVQYMLPWALYGVNELIQYVARKRNIHVGTGVSDLAALASEGVPNYDALKLVLKLDIERVDATRLSQAYYHNPFGLDILGWFKSRAWNTIAAVVGGEERRRLDPDLRMTWERLREKSERL